MAIEKEVKITGPVPGMSLTADPKSRPWRKPYQLSTIDEVAPYYMEKMLTPEFTEGLIEQVETGFELVIIADIFVAVSTMEGVHSVDLGALVSPIIIELMKAILDKEGVSYTVGDEKDDITMSKKEMIKLRDSLINEDSDEDEMSDMQESSDQEEEEDEQNEIDQIKNGLMSRVK